MLEFPPDSLGRCVAPSGNRDWVARNSPGRSGLLGRWTRSLSHPGSDRAQLPGGIQGTGRLKDVKFLQLAWVTGLFSSRIEKDSLRSLLWDTRSLLIESWEESIEKSSLSDSLSSHWKSRSFADSGSSIPTFFPTRSGLKMTNDVTMVA